MRDGMREKMSALVKVVLFLCLGAVMFWKVQDIFIPNWTTTEYKVERLDQKRLPGVDVLFLGSSHVQSGLSQWNCIKILKFVPSTWVLWDSRRE